MFYRATKEKKTTLRESNCNGNSKESILHCTTHTIWLTSQIPQLWMRARSEQTKRRWSHVLPLKHTSLILSSVPESCSRPPQRATDFRPTAGQQWLVLPSLRVIHCLIVGVRPLQSRWERERQANTHHCFILLQTHIHGLKRKQPLKSLVTTVSLPACLRLLIRPWN